MAGADIPLMVNTLDTATPINQQNQIEMQNRLATEQALKLHYDNLDAREKSRLTSTVAGAVQLKSFLDKQDYEGADNFLTQRRNALHTRMAHGENIDTEDTDWAIQQLKDKNYQELNNGISGLLAAGQVYGIIKGTSDLPADVQSAVWYQNATPDQRKAFDTTKRAQQSINLGGTQAILAPGGGIAEQYDVTPKPEQQPDFQQRQATAKAIGAAQGEAEANARKNLQDTNLNLSTFDDLKTSASSAPSGTFEDIAASLANKSGYGGSAAASQGDFKVKRAAAENAIRSTFRVVGSGAQSDADAKPFIDMLPAASDAVNVKISKIDAAVQAMKTRASELARQRGIPDPFSNSGGGAARVRITNPQTGESGTVNADQLSEAQAEGWVLSK